MSSDIYIYIYIYIYRYSYTCIYILQNWNLLYCNFVICFFSLNKCTVNIVFEGRKNKHFMCQRTKNPQAHSSANISDSLSPN